jgi:hypothetical protein
LAIAQNGEVMRYARIWLLPRDLLVVFEHQHEAEFPRAERQREFNSEEFHDQASTRRH